MEPTTEVAAGAAAGIASKGAAGVTGGGAVMTVLGWITADMSVALIGVAITVLGFVVSMAFRFIEHREKSDETRRNIARLESEEARAAEKHALEMSVLRARLRAGGVLPGEDPPEEAPHERH